MRWIGPWLLVLSAACVVPPAKEEVDLALDQLQESGDSGEQPLESEAYHLASDGVHRVAVLNVGADALTARIHALRAAHETIDVQTFVWGPDDSGIYLFRELLRAAQRGVRVRVLVDHMGTGKADSLAELVSLHENLEIRIYNPTANLNAATNRDKMFKATHSFPLLNHRMHNKVLAVDGRIGIVGGRNVQDRYFDMDPEFDYIDRDVLVLGPCVLAMERSFQEYWDHKLSVPAEYLYDVRVDVLELLEEEASIELEQRDFSRLAWADERAAAREVSAVLPHSPLRSVEDLTFYADPPGKRDHEGQIVTHMGLEQRLGEVAEEFVLIQSNYCVFSGTQFSILRRIRESNPELEIHFQTNSRSAAGCGVCWAIYRKQRMAMMLLGIRLYELRPLPGDVRRFNARYDELVAEDTRLGAEHDPYEGQLVEAEGFGPQIAIHAKTMVIDGHTVMIGSHNFDPRSEIYNTEAAVLIRDEVVTAEVAGELRLSMENANSWRVAPDPRVPVWRDFTNLIGHMSRALPTLDIWPWYYATNFELREGADPVPIDDPRFLENYEDVGPFPGVGRWERFTTWFTGAFGGFASGLL